MATLCLTTSSPAHFRLPPQVIGCQRLPERSDHQSFIGHSQTYYLTLSNRLHFKTSRNWSRNHKQAALRGLADWPTSVPRQRSVFISCCLLHSLQQLDWETSAFHWHCCLENRSEPAETLTFKRGEFVRGKTDVQAINRPTPTRWTAHRRHFYALRPAFWYLSRSDGSFNLTHRPPRAPIKADWNAHREGERVSVCVWESLNDGLFVGVFMSWSPHLTVFMCAFTVTDAFVDK